MSTLVYDVYVFLLVTAVILFIVTAIALLLWTLFDIITGRW